MRMTREFLRKHGTKLLVPLFMVFYMVSFFYLENRVNYRFHVIHSSFDKMVPFCEYFVVPYFLWFFYIAFTVLWFMFKNKDQKEYLQLIFNLGIGMTDCVYSCFMDLSERPSASAHRISEGEYIYRYGPVPLYY